MNWSIGSDPLNGSAGSSARPSVNVRNRTQTFTPVAVSLQAEIRSGFPSGVFGNKVKTPDFAAVIPIVRSTKSGFVTKAVNHPDTGYRRRFSSYVTSFIDSYHRLTRALSSPLAPTPVLGAGFFFSEVPA